MKRIAILGGGISGLTAAYELEKARLAGAPIDWHLFEAGDRLGGIIQTTRRDGYILEGGPDGWVTEKPWATELCRELGLEDQLIYSNDATRKTYILKNGELQAIPDGMRMMVTEDLSALQDSPLFSASAKAAYAAELTRAEELKASSPSDDESVADFVRRHFGDEVLTTLAAPLLSGVFGGDVHKLSVRAVMPQFVAMEREHGSLILALQAQKAERGGRAPKPIFTSLRNGLETLVEALTATLPNRRVHLGWQANDVSWLDLEDGDEWNFDFAPAGTATRPDARPFDEAIFATSLDATRKLLAPIDPAGSTRTLLPSSAGFLSLAPADASSAILVAFTWPANLAAQFTVPQGFGFLVPSQNSEDCHPEHREKSASHRSSHELPVLACTFVDQKFPHRAPAGARMLRAFFGGTSAAALQTESDSTIAATALTQLRGILGNLPDPVHQEVRRLPRSLPQYEVGHLDRMARLDDLVAQVSGLHLLGNAYRGVGLPDLIRDARAAARKIVQNATL